jgi:hypothetical protein
MCPAAIVLVGTKPAIIPKTIVQICPRGTPDNRSLRITVSRASCSARSIERSIRRRRRRLASPPRASKRDVFAASNIQRLAANVVLAKSLSLLRGMATP